MEEIFKLALGCIIYKLRIEFLLIHKFDLELVQHG